MDSFDNRMVEMEKEIMEIKHDIKSIKTFNHNAIHSITNSINSLSKQKSFNTIKSSITHINKNHNQDQISPPKLSKNNSEFILRNNNNESSNNAKSMKTSQSYRNRHKVNIHFSNNDIKSNYDNYKKHNSSNYDNSIQKQYYSNQNYNTIDVQKHRSAISPHIIKHNTNDSTKPYLYLEKTTLQPSSSSNYHYGLVNNSSSKINDYRQIFLKTKTKTKDKVQQYLKTNSTVLQSYTNTSSSKYNHFNINQSNITENINNEESKIDYKSIVNNILNIINNTYSNGNYRVTLESLVQSIKDFLDLQKRMNDFIQQLILLFNRDIHQSERGKDNNLLSNDDLLDWVVYLKQRNKKCENALRYQNFCEKIMQQQQITDFKEFKEFIAQSICNKSRNDQFVIGMKRILCEDYSRLSPSSKYNTISVNNNESHCGLRGRVVRGKKQF